MPPSSLGIPNVDIVSVEHPCVVRHDIDKAISMLGDAEDLASSLEHDADKPLGLKFQPADPECRPIVSYNIHTNNLLLKFTVPKRTGRKRKRGSDEPFLDESPSPLRKDAAYLLRSLKDSRAKCQVEAIGSIHSTHVWRTMPDFSYSTKGSTFMEEFKSKILPQDHALLQHWSLPRTYGLMNTEVFPPPVFSTQPLPANYTYRQNPAVRTIADPLTGKRSLRNNQAPLRLYTHQCHHDDDTWPEKPHPSCVPLDQQPKVLQEVCKILRTLFEQRPIWTRRALLNQLPDSIPTVVIRHAIAYVAFAIRSGPWRDTLCRLGLDPRTDRSYREYQSILVQLVSRHKSKEEMREDFSRTWIRSTDKESHIFTGKSSVPTDGKSWQLCDLHDPQLRALVKIPDLHVRHVCETRYFGWYPSGTMAKIRVAVKAKIDALIEGEPPDEAALARFLRLPDVWVSTSEAEAGYLPKNATRKELEWASAYRSLCRTVTGAVPIAGGSGKGRLSKTNATQATDGRHVGHDDGSELARTPTPQGYDDSEEDDVDGGDEDNLDRGEDLNTV